MPETRPLYCCNCGMPQYELALNAACRQCGSYGPFSTSLLLISWEVALTWADKQMLKRMKISHK